jgi:hypothetical protein
LDLGKLADGLKRVSSMPGREACAAWLNSAGFPCDAGGEDFSCIQEASQGLEDLITMMDAYKEAFEDFLEENKEGEDEDEGEETNGDEAKEGAAKKLEELVELAEKLTKDDEDLADELKEALEEDADLVFMMKEELKLEDEDQQQLLQQLEAVVAPYKAVAAKEKHRREMHQLFLDGDVPKLMETLRAMSGAEDASMATSRCDRGA